VSKEEISRHCMNTRRILTTQHSQHLLLFLIFSFSNYEILIFQIASLAVAPSTLTRCEWIDVYCKLSLKEIERVKSPPQNTRSTLWDNLKVENFAANTTQKNYASRGFIHFSNTRFNCRRHTEKKISSLVDTKKYSVTPHCSRGRARKRTFSFKE